jgi:DNA-binding SARP family transcriptional activator
MIRLRLLGSLALVHEDETRVRSLLAQPKRFAVLAYLAASPAPLAHRRDTLLGIFWPELDEEHARQALRQALHGLRRSLGPGVIVRAGDELVSVAAERVWCDAAAFASAVKTGRDEEALELYRGPFLEGFHLSGVPAFERWVDGECERFRLAAVEAAWRLVGCAAGDRAAARRWAERALDLAPFDEEGLRRYLGLMVEHGQPASAVRAYEAYTARLATELELTPAAETVALAERIRAGDLAPGRTEAPRLGIPQPAPEAPPPGAPPTAGFEPRRRESGEALRTASAAIAPTRMEAPSRRLGRFMVPPVSALILLGGALFLVRTGGEPPGPAEPATYPPTALAVLPLHNLSSEPEHAYFAGGLHDELLTQLSSVAALSLRSRSSVLGYAGTTKPIRQIADELQIGALVEGSVQVGGIG